jgi:hypothetical protein
VIELRRGRFPEERDALIAVGSEARPSIGVKHFAGRPSAHIPPWIEASLPCHDERFAAEVVAGLAALLPPGGRLMVVYGGDETERALQRGCPAVTTPLGHALLTAGCTWFKDWYYAEGGREGETKLQGNKPISEGERRGQIARLRRELAGWLAELPAEPDELTARARDRALDALALG